MVVESIADILGIPVGLFIILLIWSISWKGLALWRSARLNQPIWFIALLIINTVGILEILYLFIFSNHPVNEVHSNTYLKKSKKKK
jgi:hypothetical protein